jgi:hypothetical protein
MPAVCLRVQRDILVALIFHLVGKSMRRKLLSLGLFLCAWLTSPALAEDSKSLHLNRAQSVINAFQVICQLELPRFEFDRIDVKATAMHMQPQINTSGPSAGGSVTRRKSWVGGLSDGPYLLFLDEMSGPKAKTTSCAIVAEVPDRDAFRAELFAP